MKINAILLAAGLSKRLKGPNKLLMVHKGKTVVSNTYAALRQSDISEIVIVTGRDSGLVKTSLPLRSNDQFVHNKDFKEGMTSSIQTGLDASGDCDGLMICLGDMPWLQTEDYDLLIKEFKGYRRQDVILVPWYNESRANPVIFGKQFFDQIRDHKAPNGCAQIVRDNVEKVMNLNVQSERFIKDIDTLEDLELLD